MKIDNACKVYFSGKTSKNSNDQNKNKDLETSYYLPFSAYTGPLGQAQVNMQNRCEHATKFINSLLEPNEKIRRCRKTGDLVRLAVARPTEYLSHCETVKHVACHYGHNGNLESAYILNNKTGEISVYAPDGTLRAHFDSDETKALREYKYTPAPFHNFLRYDRKTYGGDWQEEVEKHILKLCEIFSDKNKLSKTNENMTLYRALQDNISDEDINKLCTIGEIYEDKSFVSTTRDINVAKRFAQKNPIVEIEFPKDSEYLDMDKLFNIDTTHWREDEFLLNRNSKFLITGFDAENNIVKAKYLGDCENSFSLDKPVKSTI